MIVYENIKERVILKKIIALCLIIALCFGFSACDLYKGKTRVVGITYQGEIYNGVQNQECISGLKLMMSEIRVAHFENLYPEEFEDNLRTIVGEGHEFIWCFEHEGKDILYKVSKEKDSEDTIFGLIDATYDKIPDNIVTITFREHEGAFLAGYIAAKKTETNIVGFLAGKESDVSKRYEYGYKAGVLYGAKTHGKDVTVATLYTGDDHSKSSGKEGALKLYNENYCDVIFQASQVTGLGAIEAAVECDKWIIGNGIDQSIQAPKNVLTCVTKNTKNAINMVTTKFIEDEDSIRGKNFDYGLKERVIGISKTTTNMSKDTYKEAMNLRDQIVGGTISVPYDEATFNQYQEKLMAQAPAVMEEQQEENQTADTQ